MSKTFDSIFDLIIKGFSYYRFTSANHYWTVNERKRIEEIAAALTTENEVPQLAEKFSNQSRVIRELKEQSDQLLGALNPNYESNIIRDITKDSLSVPEYGKLGVDAKLRILLSRIAHTNSEISSHIDIALENTANITEPTKGKIKELNSELASVIDNAREFASKSIGDKIWDLEVHLQYGVWVKLVKGYSKLWEMFNNEDWSVIVLSNSDTQFQVCLSTFELVCLGMHLWIYMQCYMTEQYRQMTEYYYELNKVDQYNLLYRDALSTLYNLTSDTETFFDKAQQILMRVRNSEHFQRHQDAEQFATAQLANLVEHKSALESFPKLFVSTIPKPLDWKDLLDYSLSNITTGQNPWLVGSKVSYAIQFVTENSIDCTSAHALKSIISEWTPSFVLEDKANPTVKVYPDEMNRTRVIFRRFNDTDLRAQIVAILKDFQQVTFRDIDRELFEAAAQANLNVSLRRTKFYLENGANVSAQLDNAQSSLHKAAELRDHWKVVRELLNHDAAHAQNTTVNAQDDQGRTPLYIAVENGNFEIVRNLLHEHGANASIATSKFTDHQMTPLHIAVINGHIDIVELLLKMKDPGSVNVTARTTEGLTALHFSVAYNQEPIVAMLLADNRTEMDAQSYLRCAGVPRKDDDESLGKNLDKIAALLASSAHVTPLHMAYAIGSEQLVKLLLEKGADMRMRTSDGSNVMHFAALNNVTALIPEEKCLSLNNSPNLYDLTPLFIAHVHHNFEFAQKLLNHCADVNIRLSNQRTMLHLAVQTGDEDVVQTLLSIDDGSLLNATDSNGYSTLQYAVWLYNTKMVKLLLDNGANVDALDADGFPVIQTLVQLPYQSSKKLFYLITQMLEHFIAHNVNLNASDTRHRNTFLHLCSAFDGAYLIFELINNEHVYSKLAFDALNGRNETPLYVALRMGDVTSANLFYYRFRADRTLPGGIYGNWTGINFAIVGKIDNSNMTHIAYQYEDSCLSRANAYKEMYENMLLAAQYGKYAVNQVYIVHCGFLNPNRRVTHPVPYNPFHFERIDLRYLSKLAKYGDVETLKVLYPLRRSERFGGYDFRQLPIIEALRGTNTNVEVIHFLHEQNFTLVPDQVLHNFYPQSTNWNALNYTILGSKSSCQLLELVTQQKITQFRLPSSKKGKLEIAFPELRGEHNETLMHLAAQANKVEIAQFLREKKVDLKAVDKDGYSPLHVAARYGNLEMVKWLIGNGANVSQAANVTKLFDRFARPLGQTTPLIEAVLGNGNIELVKYLTSHGAEIGQDDLCALVLVAAQANKAHIVMHLARNDASSSPLYNHFNSCYTDHEETVLHFAAANNNMLLAEFFLGSNPYSIGNFIFFSPFYYAIKFEGQLQMVEYLGSKDAKFYNQISQVYEDYTENVIALAIARNKFELAKYLINVGANVHITGKSKRTPLHEAIMADQADLIEMLVEKGAFAGSDQDSDGKTPLDYIFMYKRQEALHYFLFNYPDKNFSLMRMRTLENDFASVQWLVERGGDVNILDYFKNTPLHLAAQKGYIQVARELVLSKCVDLSIRNANNQTALDCAEANNHTDIVELLKHHGRKRRHVENEPLSMRDSMPAYHNGANTRHSSFLINSACVVGSIVSFAFERVSAHASKLMSFTFGTTNSNSIPSPHRFTNAQVIHNPNGITPNIDLNSTLLLLDVLIRRYYSGERYTMQNSHVKPVAEARACALALIDRLQEELSSLYCDNESVDWFEFYRAVEHFMISEQYGEIVRLLRITVRKFTYKQIVDDIEITRMIDKVLIETLFTSGQDNINETQVTFSNAISHNARVDLVHSKLELEVNKLDKSLI